VDIPGFVERLKKGFNFKPGDLPYAGKLIWPNQFEKPPYKTI
jgi:hypothetical protein